MFCISASGAVLCMGSRVFDHMDTPLDGSNPWYWTFYKQCHKMTFFFVTDFLNWMRLKAICVSSVYFLLKPSAHFFFPPSNSFSYCTSFSKEVMIQVLISSVNRDILVWVEWFDGCLPRSWGAPGKHQCWLWRSAWLTQSLLLPDVADVGSRQVPWQTLDLAFW